MKGAKSSYSAETLPGYADVNWLPGSASPYGYSRQLVTLSPM